MPRAIIFSLCTCNKRVCVRAGARGEGQGILRNRSGFGGLSRLLVRVEVQGPRLRLPGRGTGVSIGCDTKERQVGDMQMRDLLWIVSSSMFCFSLVCRQ